LTAVGLLELLSAPVALVAWGLLALVALSRRGDASAAARRVSLAVAVLYLAAAMPHVANRTVAALEDAPVPAARGCSDPAAPRAIVVLAGGMSGTPATSDDIASLHLATVRRVVGAARLARASPEATLLLAGGGGELVREADVMASLATALGVPLPRLILERESRTTAEAAANVARLLARERPGAGPVVLVTSAMHMPRAAAAFRRQGVELCPVRVDRRRLRPGLLEGLIPQVTALEKSTAAWHEAIGYAAYWATGRL
jgi:uncharacterized SAM-binding protein YcdF (DUF218 family)